MRLFLGARGPVRRLAQAELGEQLLEALAVLGDVDRIGRGADDRHAGALEIERELQRRLPAVLDDHADRLFLGDDLEHVLERHRLEVEAIRGVVVGRHGLWIAVDHDRLVAVLAHGEGSVDAAVVELDALADPVRAAAENHDLLALGRLGLALLLVGGVHVGGLRRELGGAGVDALVDRPHAQLVAARADRGLVGPEQPRQAAIRKSLRLQIPDFLDGQARQRASLEGPLAGDDLLDLRQEPRIDRRLLEDLVEAHADPERVGDVEEPLGAGLADLLDDLLAVARARREAVDAGLEAAQRLLQAFLERAPHRHHLADRLHLRRQARVGGRELLEREARDLGDDVVDRRLEARRRRAAGDVVLELVERVADRQLGGDLGDREAGRLRCQRGGARDARVHLDDDHPAVLRIDRELHVRAAGLDADLAQDRDRGVAHQLVFLVRQRLRRRDRDRVAGVDPHRVEVLDRADDDAVVRLVADDLHLELLPADQALLDQEFVGRREVEAALADLLELVAVVGDAAAGAAEREARPHDHREAVAAGLGRDAALHCERFLERVGDAGFRRRQSDAGHRVLELEPVLGLLDRLFVGADHLDAVLLQYAVLVQVEGAVERGLAAHRRQHRVGPLLGDDLLDHAPGDRLDVGDVGHLRVGHDRRRVAVDEDDAEALLAQRLAGLRAGVVELARLADDDRPGADDQDRAEVGALRHSRSRLPARRRARPPSRRRSGRTDSRCRAARARLPGGPGNRTRASSTCAKPCSVPSKSETWVGRSVAGSDSGSTAKPWFWLVIDDPAAVEVLDRVVGAVVAELHLVGARAGGERHDLVAEADAEGRHAALDELARRRDRVVARLGIARSVGEEDAVGPLRQHVGRRGLRRHDGDAAAARREHAQDVELDAEVVGDDVEARLLELAVAAAERPRSSPSTRTARARSRPWRGRDPTCSASPAPARSRRRPRRA